jgi:hypothetical protein
MVHDGILIKTNLRTPKAAAVAGIAFSTLSILAFGLLRIAIPDEQVPPTKWLSSQSSTIGFALNLIPFAGMRSSGSSASCGIGSAAERINYLRLFSSEVAFYSLQSYSLQPLC